MGGYKIIDLGDVQLTPGTPVKIEGTHEAIEGNYRKATLLTGLHVQLIEEQDRFVSFYYESQAYKTVVTLFDGKEYILSISGDDMVKIEAKPAAAAK